MKLIERKQYLDKMIGVIGTPDIKVMTGVRRSGKSKLLEAFKAYVQENIPDANIIPHLIPKINIFSFLGNTNLTRTMISKRERETTSLRSVSLSATFLLTFLLSLLHAFVASC